jgi:hypothetical protein
MKNRICLLTVLTFFSFVSCEEFIDLQPLDEIGMNDYWKTSTDLENYVKQFYPICFDDEVMVDDMENNSDFLIKPDISEVLNGERVIRAGNWRSDWQGIRAINIFFSNYRRCESDFDDYKHYVGEAHFFRAWLYFELLKEYGDLPWYSKPVEVDDEDELMRPRDPRTLIADSILADLDKAAMYLGKRADVGNNRINKEAALAFKTRVALYEGTWQKYHKDTPFGTSGANPNKYFQECMDAAEELMNGDYEVGIYNKGNAEKDYYEMFGLDDMSDVNEVLLYKAFCARDGFSNNTQSKITYKTAQKGITWDLVSLYLGRDGRPYPFMELAQTTKGNDFLERIATECDPRLHTTVWIPGDLMAASLNKIFIKPDIDKGTDQLCQTGFQVKKTANPYSPAAGLTYEIEPCETGLILLRYGEVLLNYAEAKCELDNTVAYAELNMLRKRAGMPDFVVNSQNDDPNLVYYGYTISDALYEIRRERAIELALEGYREEDYMRWAAHSLFQGKRPKGYPFKADEFPNFHPRLDTNGLIDYYANLLPEGYGFREDRDYLYSIPQDELVLNPNLHQNPGW